MSKQPKLFVSFLWKNGQSWFAGNPEKIIEKYKTTFKLAYSPYLFF